MSFTGTKQIVLVGPMGVGKSSVARRLAALMNLEWCDTDELVEAEVGCSISELFSTRGEQVFRELESAALHQALNTGEGCVVATGGGVVLAEVNRLKLMENGLVVWLDADVQTLLEHIGDTTSRPLFRHREPTIVLQEILEQRGPLYAEVADLRVDVSWYESADAVAKKILELLGDKK